MLSLPQSFRSLAEGLCCPSPDLSILIQDSQPVNVVHLECVEFVSQSSDAYCHLRYCCPLDHVLFGFVAARNFDTAQVLSASSSVALEVSSVR